MTPVLEFRGVERSFTRGKPVLDGATFSLGAGEVAGLLGRNGAGKTTLIQIALGSLYPHRGEVRVFGLDPTKEPVAVKKRLGYVAEDQVLPPGSSIQELIEFHRYLFPSWDQSMERELRERFGLDPKSKIIKLSKGQARQVALLLAVCHRPELLILDEPAGGLDPAARREFLETSIQLLNREGSSILFSSHHMSDVERLAARVLLLDQGKIRIDRQLDELQEGYCVAVIPSSLVSTAHEVEALPGCMRARPVFGDWHAVFEGRPADVQVKLAERFGKPLHCAALPLEELFVELLGGARLEAA